MSFYNQQPQMQFMPMKNGIIWVQGVEGAKAYPMQPSSNTILMDSENDGMFYIKVCDNVGMCTLRFFKYEEIKSTPTPTIDMTGYVKKEDLKSEVEAMLNEMLGGGAKHE